MQLSKFVDTYDLHDRLVYGVYVYPEREEVVIDCTLSMDFGVEKPEGKLIFTGVKRYEIEAQTSTYDADEILSAKVTPSDYPEMENLKLVLEACIFPGRKQEIKIIVIEAHNVEWVPNGEPA